MSANGTNICFPGGSLATSSLEHGVLLSGLHLRVDPVTFSKTGRKYVNFSLLCEWNPFWHAPGPPVWTPCCICHPSSCFTQVPKWSSHIKKWNYTISLPDSTGMKSSPQSKAPLNVPYLLLQLPSTFIWPHGPLAFPKIWRNFVFQGPWIYQMPSPRIHMVHCSFGYNSEFSCYFFKKEVHSSLPSRHTCPICRAPTINTWLYNVSLFTVKHKQEFLLFIYSHLFVVSFPEPLHLK